MSEDTAQEMTEQPAPVQMSERQLRQTAVYQKHRLAVVGTFFIAVVIAGLSFSPLGEALGGVAAGLYDSMVAAGTAGKSAGLAIMLGADAAGFVLVLLISLFVGPRVPSGFPHVVLGIIIPLTLATMQATLFSLTGGAGGLEQTEFARWSFVAMFVITLVTAEAGVTLGRRRLEKRFPA